MTRTIALIHANNDHLRNLLLGGTNNFELKDSLYKIVFNDALVSIVQEREVVLDNTHFQSANLTYVVISEKDAKISRLNVRTSTKEIYHITDFDSIEIHNLEEGTVEIIMELDEETIKELAQIKLQEIIKAKIAEKDNEF